MTRKATLKKWDLEPRMKVRESAKRIPAGSIPGREQSKGPAVRACLVCPVWLEELVSAWEGRQVTGPRGLQKGSAVERTVRLLLHMK